MRLIVKVLAGFAVVAAALLLFGFALPRHVVVERETRIEASAYRVFPHLKSMQAMAAWSPWLDRDPDVVVTYEGPEDGVGNRMTWASEHPQVGHGSQEIVSSLENTMVETALDFGPQGTAEAWLALEREEGGTIVTWGFITDLGRNPISRWKGLMFDRWIGADYELGLERLKALVET
ncbi:SRPBCC family protein [Aliiroseovarius subalbicans]|uniref:SRPBCC family protein n=1 Tax=Aliiroseovarius subalbicans TaxID=2925840 RepID=UPI001F574114|nr:SRPBCC family protein [Aliiroseovarius subalbicans]MCI2399439.1 SRPBCC family protein [Aliiroseovarius subalbicans]